MIRHSLVAFELWSYLINRTSISGFKKLNNSLSNLIYFFFIDHAGLICNTEHIKEWLRKHFQLSVPTAKRHSTQNNRHFRQLIILV